MGRVTSADLVPQQEEPELFHCPRLPLGQPWRQVGGGAAGRYCCASDFSVDGRRVAASRCAWRGQHGRFEDHGMAAAQNNLGFLYQQGQGVPASSQGGNARAETAIFW